MREKLKKVNKYLKKRSFEEIKLGVGKFHDYDEYIKDTGTNHRFKLPEGYEDYELKLFRNNDSFTCVVAVKEDDLVLAPAATIPSGYSIEFIDDMIELYID